MSSIPARPVIRVGPAGWSYPDWRGVVYPRRTPQGFHELEYLAEFFPAVEINTTFYHPPRPPVVREWVRQVEGKEFQFTAKLWQRFTHERRAGAKDERLFKEALAPLVEQGRLGALLLQFPWSFKNDPENRHYVASLRQRFREYPLVLEVRHRSWNQPEVLERLRELGIGFCNIDQPVIGHSIQPSRHVTAAVGYVRLHGRNYQAWFSSTGDLGERYNYLYSAEELEPWVERARHIAQQSKVTFVITNNHARGKAVANALQLIALLSGQPVPVPKSLIENYPDLADIAAPSRTLPPQPQLPF